MKAQVFKNTVKIGLALAVLYAAPAFSQGVATAVRTLETVSADAELGNAVRLSNLTANELKAVFNAPSLEWRAFLLGQSLGVSDSVAEKVLAKSGLETLYQLQTKISADEVNNMLEVIAQNLKAKKYLANVTESQIREIVKNDSSIYYRGNVSASEDSYAGVTEDNEIVVDNKVAEYDKVVSDPDYAADYLNTTWASLNDDPENRSELLDELFNNCEDERACDLAIENLADLTAAAQTNADPIVRAKANEAVLSIGLKNFASSMTDEGVEFVTAAISDLKPIILSDGTSLPASVTAPKYAAMIGGPDLEQSKAIEYCTLTGKTTPPTM